jgi:hypothetical protein
MPSDTIPNSPTRHPVLRIIRSVYRRPLIISASILFGLAAFLSALPSRSISAGDTQMYSPSQESSGLYQVESIASCSERNYRIPRETQGEETGETAGSEGPVFVTPPNPDGTTLVDLGLFIIEVTEINEVDNTFRIEAFMDLVWCDPREAFEPEETGVEEEIFLEEDAQEKIKLIWWPDVQFSNEAGARDIENEELIIFHDGTIEYQEKFSAVLEARYDLRQFPFDEQTLEIEIESFAWPEDILVLHEEEGEIGFSADFQIPEWNTEKVETSIEEKQEIRDREPFSEFFMEIFVSRQSGFYVWKIMVPLILLVAISWSVFWMIGDGLADRMSVSLTGILTVVAYQFIVSGDLPRVPYFTLMDTIISLSFGLMALTIVENIAVNTLYIYDRQTIANRVDRISRWAFPLVYIVGILAAAFFFISG